MIVASPIRYDRIQRGLFDMFRTALDPAAVYWGYNEPEWEQQPRDVLSMTISGGPDVGIRNRPRGIKVNPAVSIDIDVTAVNVGRTYSMFINGFAYSYVAQGGDGADDIRDALVAAVEADDIVPVSAWPNGAGRLALTADTLGALYCLRLAGDLDSANLIRSTSMVRVGEGSQTLTLTAGTFSKGREPFNGAWDLASRANAALQSTDLVEALGEAGARLGDIGAPVDISQVAPAHWETRAFFDFDVFVQAVWIRPVDAITSVTTQLALGGAGATINTSFTAVAP